MESSHHLYEERGLTVDYLNECLRYENGKLFWRNRPLSHFQSEKSYKTWTKRFAGSECGSPNSKHNKMAYLRFGIKLDGKVRLFLVHRVIWALCTGSFPSKLIDHLDGDILNNQISNLRDVSNQDNLKNTEMYSHNSSGLTGVSWYDKWSTWFIQGGGVISGNHVYLGVSKSKFEAACIRRSWEMSNGYSERHGK